jgi:hypothetical protein
VAFAQVHTRKARKSTSLLSSSEQQLDVATTVEALLTVQTPRRLVKKNAEPGLRNATHATRLVIWHLFAKVVR